KQPVLQVAIKGPDRRVIVRGIRRALLKINWEDCKAPRVLFILMQSTGEREDLSQLPAPLGAVTSIGQNRIREIILMPFSRWIGCIRKQRRQRPRPLRVPFLQIEKRAEHLGAMPDIQGQLEVVIKKSRMRPVRA